MKKQKNTKNRVAVWVFLIVITAVSCAPVAEIKELEPKSEIFTSNTFGSQQEYLEYLTTERNVPIEEAQKRSEGVFETTPKGQVVKEYYSIISEGDCQVEFGFLCFQTEGEATIFKKVLSTWSWLVDNETGTWQANTEPSAMIQAEGRKVQLVGSGYATCTTGQKQEAEKIRVDCDIVFE